MSPADQREVARRRKQLEKAMDDEFFSMQQRIDASRRRVGAPAKTASGVMGKRISGSKYNYRKTAPATTRNTERWANRNVA